jgi:hypothetical protein
VFVYHRFALSLRDVEDLLGATQESYSRGHAKAARKNSQICCARVLSRPASKS